MHNTSASILRLYGIRNSYGLQVRNEKLEIISFLSGQSRFTKNQFRQYVDVLLFLKAFPDDEAMQHVANIELNRLTNLLINARKLSDALYDSGIRNTLNRGMFSLTLTKWLRATYRQNVQLDLVVTDQKKCISILTCIMGEVPTEILQEGYMKWEQWLTRFRRNDDEDILDVLIRCFEAANVQPRTKDELWNDMGIVISVLMDDTVPWPGSNVGVPSTSFYHAAIDKNVVIADVIKRKPREVLIDDVQKNELIVIARMVLASCQRETDPVTHTQVQYSRYYDQGKGLSIALFGLPPERRQPLDSYIGYMAFKNGVPIAYGGGWILFDSCRIGVNVFPAFRGGESSFIFAQIIGLYKHVFRLNRFTVDPYQIGMNNSEGIKSGAFWMYYRLGFRPMLEAYRTLADNEFKKIVTQKPYRSPAKVLNDLANSKPELFTGEKKKAARIDATDLSLISLSLLQSAFKGDYEQLNVVIRMHTVKVSNEVERRIVESWVNILGPEQWKQLYGRQDMRELLRWKCEGDEWGYIQLLQSHVDLRNILLELLARAK